VSQVSAALSRAATGLPAMDRAARLVRLRSCMEREGCDALLVTNRVNVRYLVGFTGSAGMLLVSADAVLLTTDGRYRSQAEEELAAAGLEADLEIGGGDAQREAVSKAASAHGRVALEAAHVTWARQRAMAAAWFPEAELVATDGLVEGLREIKDAGEVARIEAAASIADAALHSVKAALDPGLTEAEVALALDIEMRRRGSEGTAFETIVAAGPNSAKPHARPTGHPVGRGQPLVMDFGAVVDGYRSDMTRTFCLGDPEPWLARLVDVVAEAQREGVASVRPERPAKEVDQVCREAIAGAGWADSFVHGTGHGVGLDIHEAPALAATSAATLSAGQVVTVEPGVYLRSQGGVRIEDTVVVTEHGSRVLTSAPKDLVISG
jgi:Xaa-Pro aminopeptidase